MFILYVLLSVKREMVGGTEFVQFIAALAVLHRTNRRIGLIAPGTRMICRKGRIHQNSLMNIWEGVHKMTNRDQFIALVKIKLN